MSQRDVRVTFIHGLANKPRLADLRRIWLDALCMPTATDDGLDLGACGIGDSFVYWADLFYDEPLPASGYEATNDDLVASLEGASGAMPGSAWTAALEARFKVEDDSWPQAPVDPALPGYERIPLPGPLKKRIMEEFVREAHAYLYDVEGVRETIRERVVGDLQRAPADCRKILVGHSQGTFIAYDVLTAMPDCPLVDGLMTIGSPLGIDEIQDRLVWTRDDGFPKKLRGDWVNVFDPFDLVSRLDPFLANDFRKSGAEVVMDIEESNWGTWRHSATKYLKGRKLRAQMRRLCGREAD